jgi:hypothetical protein
MKLSDIYKSPIREARKLPSLELTVDGDMDDEFYYEKPFTIEAEFEYEGADHTDHPYGSTTAREHHPASYGFVNLKLSSVARQMDPEDDKLVKEWPIGSDVSKMPGWNKKLETRYEEEIPKHVEGMRDDY